MPREGLPQEGEPRIPAGTVVVAALVSSALAGPVYVALIILSEFLFSGQESTALTRLDSGILVLAIPFGFAFALIPNLIGCALLAAFANENRAFFRLSIWAATGALMGLAISAYTGIVFEDAVASAILIGTAIVSALICRAWIGLTLAGEI